MSGISQGPWRVEGTVGGRKPGKIISYGINAEGDGPAGYVMDALGITDADAAAVVALPGMLGALRLTERNLGSLIAARHCDRVLMTSWREAVRKAITEATGETFPATEEEPA